MGVLTIAPYSPYSLKFSCLWCTQCNGLLAVTSCNDLARHGAHARFSQLELDLSTILSANGCLAVGLELFFEFLKCSTERDCNIKRHCQPSPGFQTTCRKQPRLVKSGVWLVICLDLLREGFSPHWLIGSRGSALVTVISP